MRARHFATHDKRVPSHPSPSGKFIPTARAGRSNAPGRSKTARSEAEVRTAGSNALIRVPVSPTGPPISLSATTLPTKKSNRPHEERILRAPPSATVRRFHAPEDRARFRPVRMPLPENRPRTAPAPAPFAAPTSLRGFPLFRRPPERKGHRRFGTGETARRPGHRIGRQAAF